jgi:hypothetical protein
MNWLFEHEEEGIILEDDCLPSPSFFKYCEVCLQRYRDDRRIWDISGLNQLGSYPIMGDASYLYSRYGGTWGWATWRDRRISYDLELKSQRSRELLEAVINNLEEWEFPEVRREQLGRIRQGLDAWDYQWLVHRLANSGLSVVPRVNLITNIGHGPAATHTKKESQFLNRERFDLDFPLTSPPSVMRDRNRDHELMQIAFGHRRANVLKRLSNRLKMLIS